MFSSQYREETNLIDLDLWIVCFLEPLIPPTELKKGRNKHIRDK